MKMKYKLILIILLCITNNTYADDGFLGSVEGVGLISKFLVQIFNLVGMAIFFNGLYGFYKRTEDPNRYTLAFCVANCVAGSLLLISATAYSWTVNSMSTTEWATDSSMLSVGSKINDDFNAAQGGFLGSYLPEQSIKTLMGFVYIAGLVGYLRGLYLLKNIGQMDNGQSGGFYKALWHILGGAATMNILKVGCFISWLLGISMLCSE
jgi:hypothetical protein